MSRLRKFASTAFEFAYWTIVVAMLVAAVAFTALTIHGCSPSKDAEYVKATTNVDDCSRKITEAVFRDDDGDGGACTSQESCCNQAQLRVDGLIRDYPPCRAFVHFEVCGLLPAKDGGKDGSHD